METLITLPTAKLAKEKGFDLYSPAYYTCDNPSSGKQGNQLSIKGYVKWIDIGDNDSQEGTLIYSAPTQNMLQKWIREIHNIYILIDMNINREYYWKYFDDTSAFVHSKGVFKTYEEALENGLYEALNLIGLEDEYLWNQEDYK